LRQKLARRLGGIPQAPSVCLQLPVAGKGMVVQITYHKRNLAHTHTITTALLQVLSNGVPSPGKSNANFTTTAGIQNIWLIY